MTRSSSVSPVAELKTGNNAGRVALWKSETSCTMHNKLIALGNQNDELHLNTYSHVCRQRDRELNCPLIGLNF